MPKTKEITAYYIRTRKGETFYVDTLAEALTELVGEDGYRVTFSAGGKEVDLRRSSKLYNGLNGDKECEATIVYREKGLK